MGKLTDEEMLEYLRLVDRRLEIHLNFMGKDWKPAYSMELDRIEWRLKALREKVDAEHERRAEK